MYNASVSQQLLSLSLTTSFGYRQSETLPGFTFKAFTMGHLFRQKSNLFPKQISFAASWCPQPQHKRNTKTKERKPNSSNMVQYAKYVKSFQPTSSLCTQAEPHNWEKLWSGEDRYLYPQRSWRTDLAKGSMLFCEQHQCTYISIGGSENPRLAILDIISWSGDHWWIQVGGMPVAGRKVMQSQYPSTITVNNMLTIYYIGITIIL